MAGSIRHSLPASRYLRCELQWERPSLIKSIVIAVCHVNNRMATSHRKRLLEQLEEMRYWLEQVGRPPAVIYGDWNQSIWRPSAEKNMVTETFLRSLSGSSPPEFPHAPLWSMPVRMCRDTHGLVTGFLLSADWPEISVHTHGAWNPTPRQMQLKQSDKAWHRPAFLHLFFGTQSSGRRRRNPQTKKERRRRQNEARQQRKASTGLSRIL